MRSEARRGHDDQSVHEARMLKSDYDMTWIIWFWYITKPKFVSDVSKQELANHALQKIYGFVGNVHNVPLRRYNDSGVTKYTQNLDENMCKWAIFWKVSFVKYELTIIQIRIIARFCKL